MQLNRMAFAHKLQPYSATAVPLTPGLPRARQAIYGFTDLDGSQPDAWRYAAKVRTPGRPDPSRPSALL
jgi:hypothetical protein